MQNSNIYGMWSPLLTAVRGGGGEDDMRTAIATNQAAVDLMKANWRTITTNDVEALARTVNAIVGKIHPEHDRVSGGKGPVGGKAPNGDSAADILNGTLSATKFIVGHQGELIAATDSNDTFTNLKAVTDVLLESKLNETNDAVVLNETALADVYATVLKAPVKVIDLLPSTTTPTSGIAHEIRKAVYTITISDSIERALLHGFTVLYRAVQASTSETFANDMYAALVDNYDLAGYTEFAKILCENILVRTADGDGKVTGGVDIPILTYERADGTHKVDPGSITTILLLTLSAATNLAGPNWTLHTVAFIILAVLFGVVSVYNHTVKNIVGATTTALVTAAPAIGVVANLVPQVAELKDDVTGLYHSAKRYVGGPLMRVKDFVYGDKVPVAPALPDYLRRGDLADNAVTDNAAPGDILQTHLLASRAIATIFKEKFGSLLVGVATRHLMEERAYNAELVAHDIELRDKIVDTHAIIQAPNGSTVSKCTELDGDKMISCMSETYNFATSLYTASTVNAYALRDSAIRIQSLEEQIRTPPTTSVIAGTESVDGNRRQVTQLLQTALAQIDIGAVVDSLLKYDGVELAAMYKRGAWLVDSPRTAPIMQPRGGEMESFGYNALTVAGGCVIGVILGILASG